MQQKRRKISINTKRKKIKTVCLIKGALVVKESNHIKTTTLLSLALLLKRFHSHSTDNLFSSDRTLHFSDVTTSVILFSSFILLPLALCGADWLWLAKKTTTIKLGLIWCLSRWNAPFLFVWAYFSFTIPNALFLWFRQNTLQRRKLKRHIFCNVYNNNCWSK